MTVTTSDQLAGCPEHCFGNQKEYLSFTVPVKRRSLVSHMQEPTLIMNHVNHAYITCLYIRTEMERPFQSFHQAWIEFVNFSGRVNKDWFIYVEFESMVVNFHNTHSMPASLPFLYFFHSFSLFLHLLGCWLPQGLSGSPVAAWWRRLQALLRPAPSPQDGSPPQPRTLSHHPAQHHAPAPPAPTHAHPEDAE